MLVVSLFDVLPGLWKSESQFCLWRKLASTKRGKIQLPGNSEDFYNYMLCFLSYLASQESELFGRCVNPAASLKRTVFCQQGSAATSKP